MSKDYYKILGVDKGATAEEIKKAFKKLAMEHHPDKPGGNEAKFKEINEAYQILGDQEKRAKFDQFGSDFESQGGWSGAGGSWEDFMNNFRAQGGGQGDFGGIDLGDIFGSAFGFGGGGRGARQSRGRDIQVDVELDFKEAAFGVERELNFRKQSTCDVCSGSGSEPGSKVETCSQCRGQGQVTQQQRTMFGIMQAVVTCPTCQGRGKKSSVNCKHCGGDGILSKNVSLKVKIPAGIDNGESIRLSGHGEAAPHGAGSGDLYVRVRLKPNKLYHREGFDVFSDLEINFSQAVLGDKVEVETIDGPVNLVIPEGIESGQLIKIRGKGITHLGRSTRGDHLVKVKIRVPKRISRQAKKLLEELKSEI